jgi:hypothetical protein
VNIPRMFTAVSGGHGGLLRSDPFVGDEGEAERVREPGDRLVIVADDEGHRAAGGSTSLDARTCNSESGIPPADSRGPARCEIRVTESFGIC